MHKSGEVLGRTSLALTLPCSSPLSACSTLTTGSSTPLFWGECGSVKPRKLKALAEAFPSTAFAVAKWGRSDLRGYAANLRTELDLPADRAAPFELLNFPSTSIDDFLSDDGEIAIGFDDLTIVDLRPSQEEEMKSLSSRARGGKSRRRR